MSSPIFYVSGSNILTLPLLHGGGTIIVQRESVPEATCQIMDDHDVAKMFVLPMMVNPMVNIDGWQETYDLNALELMIAGGEPSRRH